MQMARVDLAPGIEDRDHRLAHPVLRPQPHLSQPRALAKGAQIIRAKPAEAAELFGSTAGIGGGHGDQRRHAETRRAEKTKIHTRSLGAWRTRSFVQATGHPRPISPFTNLPARLFLVTSEVRIARSRPRTGATAMLFLKRFLTAVVLCGFLFVFLSIGTLVVSGAVVGASAAVDQHATDYQSGQIAGREAGQKFGQKYGPVIFLGSAVISFCASFGIAFSGLLPWCRPDAPSPSGPPFPPPRNF